MKNFLIVVVIMSCAFYFFTRQSPDKIEVLVIGSECDYVPNNWEEDDPSDSNVPLSNKKGSYADGYDIQIAKLVAKKMGVRLEVKKIDWQDLLPALNRREIDAVFSGMLDTDERKEQAAFTIPYEVKKTEYTLLMNKASKYSNGRTLNDFAGAVIIAQVGTNLDAAVNQIPGVVHAEPVETASLMIEKLVANEVDGIVIDLDSGRSYERRYNNLVQIIFPQDQGFKVGYTGVCAAVRKRDANLKDAINNAIDDISVRERRRIFDRVISTNFRNF